MVAGSSDTSEADVGPTTPEAGATEAGTEGFAAVGATLEAVREMVAALLGLARLELARAARGLVGAALLGVAALVLVGVAIVLIVALLLLGLLELSGSLAVALAVTATLAVLGIWLMLRAARRMLRPLGLPTTRAELQSAFEPLRRPRA